MVRHDNKIKRADRGGGDEMSSLEEARKAAAEYLKRTLNVKEVKVVKIAKANGGWGVEAEVYEESSFIKALGLSTKVQDRNYYEIKLDNNLEVESYAKKAAGE